MHPALALWLIAPIFGELFSGSLPLNEYLSPLSILIMGMLYGSGAIIIREIVTRWQKGWGSLLLLGMAYGIYEEGLVVRSFFDPNWMDLDKLGIYGRVAGVNWVWLEHLTIFHAVISIAASIVFVEILFSDKRSESWVSVRGLVWNIFAFVAMLPIGSLLNPYNTPDVWLGFSWFVIILLVLAAWRFPKGINTGHAGKVPRPRWFWWTAFLGTFLHFFIVYYTAQQNKPHFILTMLIITLIDLSILWIIQHWNGYGSLWDDRHRLALICGSLSFFLILGPLTTNGQYPVMYFSNPIFLALLWWVYHKVNHRVKSENAIG